MKIQTADVLLNNPRLNKGTAFTAAERKAFKLHGKLPPQIETLEKQVKRSYAQLQSFTNPLQKNIFLQDLHNTNQVLFYKLAATYIEEITPLIYTPHVATNCQTFSQEFRRPCGLYISYEDRYCLKEIINEHVHKNIELIVVTDGERILGIGDQGVGGIGIPIGKLMLYSLFGGIDPAKTLPIVLDVGTNNKELLSDPMYLGLRKTRTRGKKYMDFIDQFVSALKKKLPHVFLQWEDFGRENASVILNHYRKKICSFNDDIQGTAVITLAAILSALNITQQKLIDQNIVILGAGSAALGITNLIIAAMKKEGLTHAEARKKFWHVDRFGLLTRDAESVTKEQAPFIHEACETKEWKIKNKKNISLFEVIQNIKPQILLGCSAAANSFTKEVVTEMAKYVENPIIFPLSNPNTNSECAPENLINWTRGRALVATGSPFDPVIYNGKKIIIAQCNNALAFPGIGLGITSCKAKIVTDEMLFAAVDVIKNAAPSYKDLSAPLLPPLKTIPLLSQKIAVKIAEIAFKEKITKIPPQTTIKNLIAQNIWLPKYHPINKF